MNYVLDVWDCSVDSKHKKLGLPAIKFSALSVADGGSLIRSWCRFDAARFTGHRKIVATKVDGNNREIGMINDDLG